jgi:iron complex outermembrane receptor protein
MSCTRLISAVLAAVTLPVSAEDRVENAISEENYENIETITVIGEAAYEKANLGGTNLSNLPLASYVVNRSEIERLRFVDPDEFLDRIPGETQVRNLRIPNGSKSYTVPLVDGTPLASPYNGATQDITTVNSFDIERVEIIKGPASALYPNNAFGGVINVVTRDAPEEFEGRVWGEVGSFNRVRTGASMAGSSGDFGFFFDANTQNLDGLRDTYKNDRDQLSAKVLYTPSDDTKMFIRYEHLKRDEIFPGDLREAEYYTDPTVVGATAGSMDFVNSDAVSFKLEQSLSSGYLEVSTVYRVEDTIGDGRFSPPQEESDKSLHTKLMYRHDFEASNLIVGGEYFKGDTNADQYGDDDVYREGDVALISNSDLRITSLFGQYSLSPIDKLNFTLGVRHENIDMETYFPLNISTPEDEGQTYRKNFKNTAPKFGVTYELTPNTLLWAGYSKGFLAPSIDDLFLNRPAANPDLKAEKARNIEFGIRGTIGRLGYNSSYYHTRINNYLVTEDDGFTETTTNAGQVTVQGIESVLEFALSEQWRFSTTHTYSKNVYDVYYGADDDGDNDLSGNQLSRSPKHHLNTRIAWVPIENLVLEAEGDFYSGYYTNDDNSIDPEGKFDRAERLNFRASYNFGAWSVWLHALNITDTLADRVSYTAPSSRGAGRRNFRIVDGRTIYGGIAFNF